MKNKNRFFNQIVLAAICMLTLMFLLPNQERQVIAAEIKKGTEKEKEIQNKKEEADGRNAVTIKVAFYPLDGFFEYDEDGKESGYGVDYLNELKKYANIEWEYVPADSWEGIKQMMIDGKVDVRMPVSEPTTPSGDYDYTVESVMSTYHAIMTLRNREDLFYQDYETLSNLKIGITRTLLEKTGVSAYMESIGVLDQVVYYEDYNTCKDALSSGEIDGLISNVMDLTEDMKLLDKFCVIDNYITTWKGNPYYAILNNAMTQLKLENPSFQSSLYQEYYSDWATEPLTKEESQYIALAKSLTVAVYPDRKPVSYYDEETGSYKGIAIDLANLLSEKAGIPFSYTSITTQQPYEMLEHADLLMPVPDNADIKKYFVTKSLLDTEIFMAVRSGEEELKEDSRIGVLSTTPGILRILQGLNHFEIVSYSSNKEALRALQKGEIRAFANSSYVINWQLENPRYSNLTCLRYQKFPLDFEIAGKSEDILLQSILNKGISAISSEERDKIIQKDSTFSLKDMTSGDKLYFYRYQLMAAGFCLLLLFFVVFLYHCSQNKYIEKIRESGRQQEKANLAKSEFLARMSHDMRTPLNVIIGMVSFARENKNSEDTEQCLDKIYVASEFLLGLINDVLDMEYIESGKMELHLIPYSGAEFSQYIDSVISPLCEQKNIHFTYSYEGSNDFLIMQDKLRINQLYFNLLSNAVKYTPEGGNVVFHTVITRTNRNTIQLDVTISDDGIGMSEEFQQKMFEPFAQENQEVKPIGDGTGLGLSIVKKICDMMQMDISVKSTLKCGTTFILHGEYAVAQEQETLMKNHRVNGTSLLKNSSSDSDLLKNKTILVCEDHPINQQIIKRLLEKRGVVVLLADDGKRGVELFSRTIPGDIVAVLMDIRMPVMDGLQATKMIRALKRADAKTVPIIALTANVYEADIRNCLNAGMNAHLAKPIKPEEIYEILSTCIAKENAREIEK